MSYLARLNLPCTLHLSAPTGSGDGMGDPATGDTDVAWTCDLQEDSASELRDGRMVLVSVWTLLLAPDPEDEDGNPVSVDGLDAVTVAGTRYSIEGDPWQVRNPRTGIVHHIEAVCRKVG